MATRNAARDFALFLHGDYRKPDLPYYRSECKGRTLIAVDGGYAFFEMTGLKPHVLIGDFDSLRAIPSDLTDIEVIEYRQAKDKTDGELALMYCLDRGARVVTIVQPSFGEPDQFLGNLMLLTLPDRGSNRTRKTAVRVVNPAYEVIPLRDTQCRLVNAIGDTVSIVPVGSRIIYSCKGTEFTCTERRIDLGSSQAMRNTVVRNPAYFRVKGTALLIHQFLRHRRKV